MFVSIFSKFISFVHKYKIIIQTKRLGNKWKTNVLKIEQMCEQSDEQNGKSSTPRETLPLR